MIPKQPATAAILFLAASFSIISCTRRGGVDPVPATSDTAQYSIRNFIRGQVAVLYGQPFVLERKFRDRAGLDSSMVALSDINWDEVIPVFAKTDISDPRFIGAYSFTIADDDLTATRILTYTARRQDLYTQLFQIGTDPTNFRVTSIYIETRSSGFWRKVSQKLLYIPGSIIQIQESTDPLLGSAENKRLEYRFGAATNEDTYEETAQ